MLQVSRSPILPERVLISGRVQGNMNILKIKRIAKIGTMRMVANKRTLW